MKKNVSIYLQIKALMFKSNRWWTIPELQRKLKGYAMETTISARIRDLRKPRFDHYEVQRRLRKGTRLHEYRLVR